MLGWSRRRAPTYLDVGGRLSQSLADRVAGAAPPQLLIHRPQEGEQRSTDPVCVAMSIFSQLDVVGPLLLVFNAPALSDEACPSLLRGADASVPRRGALVAWIQVPPQAALAIAVQRVGVHLRDSGSSMPFAQDALWCLLGSSLPDSVMRVALLELDGHSAILHFPSKSEPVCRHRALWLDFTFGSMSVPR